MRGRRKAGLCRPLLSNIVLDEFDRELERRGLRFARYADDCNIYVRSRRAGERVMAEHHALHHDEAQAQGERAEECGGAAMGAEVSGLQLHGNRRAKTADRAESGAAGSRSGSGTDEPDARREHRTDGRGAGPVSAGLAWLFREVPNAFGAGGSGGVDPAQATVCDLEAVEAGFDAVCRTAQTGRGQGPGRANGGQRPRSVETGELARASYRTAQCLLRLARDSEIDCRP